MTKLLLKLGFTEKEVTIYLVLLELGSQPAANIARKVQMPKSTVLFILENLTERGYVQKSKRGVAQYFYADPKDLASAKKQQHQIEDAALSEVVPLLEELKTPFSAQPRVTFYEGKKGCRQAYSKILESTEEVLEFGIHKDLEAGLGTQFMNDFIESRCERKLHLRAISSQNAVDLALHKKDEAQLRLQKFLPTGAETYSSIAIWENKVLLLNLHTDSFGILIENTEFSQTLRTIFEVLYQRL